MYSYAPIAVFAYNRPHYLKQTLEALAKNKEASESVLYIFCDGPKANATKREVSAIKEVSQVAYSKKWCKEVHIVKSDNNKGLSEAIISGVSLILKHHDRIIVLEDDLVTSPYFLNYMNSGLQIFNNDERVISVVGYNYPIIYDEEHPQTFFLKSADCLGWGTWKRGWDLFEPDASKLLQIIKSKNLGADFNFNNQYQYMRMLKAVARGQVNSWAVRWYATAFVNDKLSLFPKKSLVRHIGNVGSNVKADNSDIFGWEISHDPVVYYEPLVQENLADRKSLSMHFKKYNRRRVSLSNLKYAYMRFIKPLFK